jgi:hypothetical protein
MKTRIEIADQMFEVTETGLVQLNELLHTAQFVAISSKYNRETELYDMVPTTTRNLIAKHVTEWK